MLMFNDCGPSPMFRFNENGPTGPSPMFRFNGCGPNGPSTICSGSTVVVLEGSTAMFGFNGLSPVGLDRNKHQPSIRKAARNGHILFKLLSDGCGDGNLGVGCPK